MLKSFASGDQVGQALGAFVAQKSQEAINSRGKFTIALSGGSLPAILNKGLQSLDSQRLDFAKWHVFFADERCVPLDHQDSNYKAVKEAMLDHVAIPSDQVYTIDASLSPEQAAKDYTNKLAQVFGPELARFDLILLGMGPDGHTCSLFPGHPLLNEHKLQVTHIEDSPKPPPRRITLTYPVVNNARIVAFVATGESKAALLPHMLGLEKREQSLPAARVHPTSGELFWFVDAAAASKVPANYPKM